MEKITNKDLTVETLFDGSLRVSCFVGIVWRHRRYYGYSKRDAMTKFKNEVAKFLL
jgi:hypothetical protein